MAELPLISVCVITYNHEQYILDCLEGIISQNYPNIELIISNDASSDNTHSKIKSFIEKIEQSTTITVKYFNQSKNLGICPNLKFAMDQCTGEFIALCEGDDYWVSHNKLRRQFEAIANTKYTATFHDVHYKRNGDLFESFLHKFAEVDPMTLENVGIKELMNVKWLVPTCSFFFRRNCLELPDFYNELKFGDFPLFCSVAAKGDFLLLDGIEAVYRMDNPSSQINKVDPLGSVVKHLDFIRFLNWLRKFKDEVEIEQRIQFHLSRSKIDITSFQRSFIYRKVLNIQTLVKFFHKWK
jgi:glycosyltransferase involved in cell wall biosynthesis